MALCMAVSGPCLMLGLAILLPLMLLGLDGGVMTALLSWGPMPVLACLSFGVYLVHYGIM